jgi:hypothetical protein
MKSCKNCFNCVVRVTLEPAGGGSVKVFKDAPLWANLRFVYHEVRCKCKMWKHEKEDKERFYKKFANLSPSPALFSYAATCPQYDG